MVKVFGITGTNGKTTASWMLRNILEQESPCGMIGTIGHVIGNTGYGAENTTPGRETIEKFLSEMDGLGITRCVMEVSSHGIDQGRVSQVDFAGAGFTNLSRDHLDYHKSMERYYRTKRKLFLKYGLKSTINIDDFYGRRMYQELIPVFGKKMMKSFSLADERADYYGRIVKEDMSGTGMKVYIDGTPAGEITTPIPGSHIASDALLAAAMADREGIGFGDICKGIGNLINVPGRMEKVGSPEDTLGIIDYAHTPDSLEQLLKTAGARRRGRLICVFGCGGYRDKGKRPLMGDVAGRYSDYCIVTNDNPRGEPPENIIMSIEEGLHPTGCEYCVILDRYQAIKRAVSLAGKWDIIVVAGKGHESYQISGSRYLPFDDRKVLRELLEKKYEKTYDEPDRTGNRRNAD